MADKLHTTESLQSTFFNPGKRWRLAQQASVAWMRRAAALARAGLHQEANDAETEAVALGRLADDLL